MTVFLSMDLVLFYLGFELVLFPVMVLISGWGSEAARAVARRFVLFTLTGSIPMVIALVAIAVRYSPSSGGTILMEELSRQAMLASANETPAGQAWIFWLLVFGFGIKMALLPLHSWLPSVYCESHPTTTALLAGVVLKMGLFGFLRIALPMVPLACNEYAPLLLGASGAIAIVYGAMAALAQTDLRLLLAYGSLSHVGFISLGLFSLTEEGIGGASLQMFNHGLTTAAMFLLVGCIIQRRGSAQVGSIGHGLAQLYPRLAVFFMLFAFAGIGMPGLNNFVGEVLALSGMMAKHPVLSMIGATGIVLGAWYTLRLARDVIFGTAEAKSVEDSTGGNRDLAPREWLAMSALSLVCIALGVWPQPALSFFERDVQRLADIYVAIETSGETSARGISSTRETDLVPGSGEGQRLP
jgi:NADH-quinone oxidoreductase subunit M